MAGRPTLRSANSSSGSASGTGSSPMPNSRIINTPGPEVESINMWQNAQGCISKVHSESTNFVWKIENFSLLENPVGKVMNSTLFNSSGDNKWCLELYTHGNAEENSDYVGLFLSLKQCPRDTSIQTKYKFHVLDLEDKIVLRGKDVSHTFTDKDEASGWGWAKFLLRSLVLDESKGYLINDKFSIGLELTIIKNVEHAPSLALEMGPTPKLFQVSDYSEYLLNGKYSDVEIVDADDNVIHAHKLVLCGNSSVFDAMFEHQMKEGTENRVVIPDIKPFVLNEMLKFIYSGKLDSPDNIALIQDLLPVADQYDIGPLKELCEVILIKNMSNRNVITSLLLGHSHVLPVLKARAINFVKMNKDVLFASSQWKEFLGTNPTLANQVLIEIINSGLGTGSSAPGSSNGGLGTRIKQKKRRLAY